MAATFEIERFRVGDEISPGYVRMVRAGGFVFVSGIGGRDLSADQKYIKDGVEVVRCLEKGYPPTIEEQTELVFKRWKDLLAKAGTSLDNVLHCCFFVTDVREQFKFLSAIQKYWFKDNTPCGSMYGGIQFSRPNMRMAFEIVAAMTSLKIERFRQGDEVTPGYVRMLRVGDFVFVSGIGGRDLSADQKYIKDGVGVVRNIEEGYAPTVEEQTELVFKRWKDLLAKAGTSLDNVVLSRLFMTDIRDLFKVLPIIEKYWGKENAPCLSAYGGIQFGRPNMRMEIEIVAAMPGLKIERFRVGNEISPGYARMVKVGNLVFVSEIGGRDLSADEKYIKDGVEVVRCLEKGYPPKIEEQTELVFKRWKDLLAKAGTSLDNVVQSRFLLTDMRDTDKVLPIIEKYWGKENAPCGSMYGGIQFSRPNMRIGSEMIAGIPGE